MVCAWDENMDKKLLYQFFEGKCSPEGIREVRSWMESSPDNEKTFLEESYLYDTIDLLAAEDIRPVSRKKSIITPLWKEVMKVAATVAIVLSVVGIWEYTKETADKQAMNVIYTPPGKNVNIVLPDGSNVWLNARTKMEYPSSFEKGKREIRLDGEAYFEVSHDKKQPFIVHTKEYNIEVLGTKFNVESYSFQDRTITSLMEGAVKLTSLENDMQSFLLKPSHMAYIQNGKFHSEEIKDYGIYRWKEGLICFDNISFPDLMKKFEQHFDVKIIIENEKVKKYLCTGKFRQSDGIDYALRILQNDISFEFNRVENTTIIHIK